MPRYELHATVTQGEHTFACYDVVGDDGLVDEVAAMVRELYLAPDELIAELREAATGLGEVADDAALALMIDRVAAAAIPAMDPAAQRPWFQTPRNEVAEVLALDVMERIHKAVVPASRVKFKEVGNQPSRGLDVLALDLTTDQVCVVLSEVKATSAPASPPPVVGTTGDSMKAETLKRLRSTDAIIAELNWALKHAKPAHKGAVAKAIVLHARLAPPPPTPLVAPVLVRPPERYSDSDYGCFKDAPSDYAPSRVAFVVLRLPWTLEEFADLVYSRARGAA